MYKSFTAEEFKIFFGLPNDYKIKGFISYGAWDDEKHFNNIKNSLKELAIDFTAKKLTGFLSHILEITVNDKKYWFSINYGSAMLSEYLHLACLFGSEKNIHIGSFGGLYPKMNSMELLMPTWSFSQETSALVYDKNTKDFKHYPDINLIKLIKSKIPKKYKVWEGPIITNQAMMGETFDDVKSWSKDGYYGVEMETATIFAVSKHFNVPSGSILYNTDNLINGQTVGDDSHKNEKAKREEVKKDVYRIAIETILGLNR